MIARVNTPFLDFSYSQLTFCTEPSFRAKPLEQFLPGGVGIQISGGAGSRVLGNSIGINPGGMGAIPPPGYELGVIIEDVANNIIGGTTAAARNTIAGAVRIIGAGATNNIVQGNTVSGDGSYGVSILGS